MLAQVRWEGEGPDRMTPCRRPRASPTVVAVAPRRVLSTMAARQLGRDEGRQKGGIAALGMT